MFFDFRRKSAAWLGKRTRRKRESGPARRLSSSRLRLEPLEPRWLLDTGPLYISEFMADNANTTFLDKFGKHSDWIEIYNPTGGTQALDGYYLTDDPGNLTKWQFPDPNPSPTTDVPITAGGYLVVFASNEDLAVAGQELHTNFKIDAGGGYLALVQPDGTTIASQYNYPNQIADVSYGLTMSNTTLVTSGASGTTAKVLVPTSSTPSNWMQPAPVFDDTSWTISGKPGIGFDNLSAQPLPTEVESNDTSGTANNAVYNFTAFTGNLYHLGIKGTIPTTGSSDDDYFKIGNLQIGDVISISQSGVDSSRGTLADPKVYLYRAGTSSSVKSDDISGPGNYDALIARYSITIDDVYYVRCIRATGTDSVPYTYQLGVWLEKNGTTPPTTGGSFTQEAELNNTKATANDASTSWRAVQYQSHTTGSIDTTGDVDFYRYQFSAGDLVTVNIDSISTLDAKVTLQNSSGTTIALEDGTSSFVTPYILDSPIYAYIIPTSGDYYVKAQTSNTTTGSYSADVYLSTTTPPPPSSGGIDYNSLIQTDINTEMSGINPSAYIRIPFSIAYPGDVATLMLRMKYDDGFVAYLNGVEVARRNAPGTAGTPPAWNAAATAEHIRSEAVVFENIDISSFKSYLGSGNLLAIQGLNLSAGDADFLVLPELTAVALSLNSPQFFSPSTPGAANSTSTVLGQVSDTKFSVDRGFFDTPFDVTITNNTSGAEIHYTINGREPGAADNTKAVSSITRSGTTATATITAHGYAVNDLVRISGAVQPEYNGVFLITSVAANTFNYTISGSPATPATGTITAQDNYFTYTGPIHVATTTTIRAAAFKTGYVSSNVDTETYIFLNDVIHQPHNPAGYPTQWISQANVAAPANQPGETGADYEMDPQVVNDPAYSSQLINDLKSIPSISLVMNPDDWFGNGSTGTNGIKGIYSNANPSNPDPQPGGAPDLWERETSVELVNPDGSVGFQINAGINIHGGGSSHPEKTPKHAFTVSFKNEYEGNLNYPLFGPDAAGSFGSFILRAGFNNSWTHWDGVQRTRGILVQDEWGAQTQLDMGDLGRHGTFVHLYINGLYWGVYNLAEVPDADFAAAYLGGDKADYDVVKVNEDWGMVASDGNLTAYLAMFTAADAGLSTPEAYANFQKYLNIPSFIDYMIMKFYSADQDWDRHNWTAIRRSRVNGVANDTLGGFIFVNWDGERTLEGTGDNKIGYQEGNPARGPGHLFNQLKLNPEFRLLWADRLHKFLFNNGALTPTEAAQRFAEEAAKVDSAMVAETARWGDYRRDVYQGTSGPYDFYTRNASWVAERDRLLNSYFPVRTSNFLSHNQNYRVNGNPLYPALIAPEYSQPNGGYIDGPLTLPNYGGLNVLYYTLDGSDPRVTDTVRLVFNTGIPVEVKSITRSGSTATVRLPNHGFVNGQSVSISGANESQYNNSSAVILNVTQDTFDYAVSGTPNSPATGTIYVTPYGIIRNGSTAIVTLPGHGFSNGERVLMTGAAQTNYNGIVTISNVTPNTFSYTVSGSPASPATGTIYARRVDKAVTGITYSGTTATATVAGHGFATGDLVRIVGASPTQYNGDFIISVVDANTFTYTMASAPISDATGVMAAIKVVSPTAIRYTGPITLTQSARVKARVINTTTWSALNDQQFYVNTPAAAGNLAVTEVNYHPVAPAAGSNYNTDDFQFIELKNTSSTQTIDLTDVQLTLGYKAAFNFTGGAVTTLSPGAYVLIAENSDALLSRYGGGIASQIAGEFSGELDHGSERICLRDYAGNTIVDFTYSDGGAWPGRADGDGYSLEVVNPTGDYTDPNNWRSSIDYNGSPGLAGIVAPAGVVINEVLSHTDFPFYDSIELYNTTANSINIGGWFLSDSGTDSKKFRIPDGTILGAGQYLVLDDRNFNLAPYAGNDKGFVSVDSSVAVPELHLQGDSLNNAVWRRIPIDYTFTANTILDFEFMSLTQGTIHGIGLDGDDLRGNGEAIFQVYGTATSGATRVNDTGGNYYNTPGVWKSYSITVGGLPGAKTRLFFGIDDPSLVGAESYFRNVRIHEPSLSGTLIDLSRYFGLDGAHGDDVWLVEADGAGNLTQFVDHVSFDAAANPGGTNPESFGRWPNATGDLYPQVSRTLGAANSGPRVGPALPSAGWLVISEVMYHPPTPTGGFGADELEYVKIYNPGGVSVILASLLPPPNPNNKVSAWRLRGDVDFDFAVGTTIAAGGSLLVVPFDPVKNTDALARFQARYPNLGATPLVGPYSGQLDNGGGTVRLLRPDTPPLDEPTYVPHLIEDEVNFNDSSPWPVAADGTGYSLVRQAANTWGDDPSSWSASTPSLGFLENPPVATDDNYTVLVNGSLTIAASGLLANDTDADPSTTLTVVWEEGPSHGALILKADGSVVYKPVWNYRGTDTFTYKASDGQINSNSATVTITVTPIAGRYTFYNNSRYDGHPGYLNGDPAANIYDSSAIATNKQALLAEQTATFANYTSYSRGINGIMVDILGLTGTPTAADFLFKVGNDSDTSGWTTAPAPSSVTVRAGGGISGSSRVTLIWPDNSIQNKWLQITVLADANTGLATPDVFYFGNAIGESGNNSGNAVVDAQDELASRTHKTGFSMAAVTNLYDYNRDGKVNAADDLIARDNASGSTPLQLISVPAGGPLAALDELQPLAVTTEIVTAQPVSSLLRSSFGTPLADAPSLQKMAAQSVPSSTMPGSGTSNQLLPVLQNVNQAQLAPSAVDNALSDRALIFIPDVFQRLADLPSLETSHQPASARPAMEGLNTSFPSSSVGAKFRPISVEKRLHDAVFTYSIARRSLSEDILPDNSAALDDIETLIGGNPADTSGKSSLNAIDNALLDLLHGIALKHRKICR